MQKLGKFFKLITIIIVIAMLTAGCSLEASKTKSGGTELNNSLSKAVWNGDTFVADFDSYDSTHWEKAHGWSNGWPFDCSWYDTQVTVSNGTMILILDDDPGQSPAYKSGEYRSREFFHYGYYEVKMKATKNIGVVSSFFTYTGPSDGNPWDEIDIEFLGKDTTQVQFNYYTGGQGHHEHMHNLGFDAADDYHIYGFDWQPDKITWYVDGVAVHSATENLPSTPSKIMMNLWPGTGVDGWLGVYNGATPLYAYYDYVKYSPTVISSSSSSVSSSSSSVSSSSISSSSSSSSIGEGITAEYITSDDWGSGFVANVTIHNNTNTVLNNWTLEWTYSGNQTITNSWNVDLTQTGKDVTAKNNPGTNSVPANGSYTFGFQGSYSGNNEVPLIIINGQQQSSSSSSMSSSSSISSSSSSTTSSASSSSTTSSSSSSTTSSSSSSSSSSSISGNYTAISVPHVQDGVGEYFWKTADNINYINSWNLDLLEINGMDITNNWTNGGSLPPKQDGYYYIHYIGAFGWSHGEIK